MVATGWLVRTVGEAITGESYGFAPYHDTWAEKIARHEAAKRADRRDHAQACVLGILTSRSVAAALPGRQQAALLSATPSPRTAQGLGPCLPSPCRGWAPGHTQGKAPRTAAAPATAGPAGVPGGSGSRGAAHVERVA